MPCTVTSVLRVEEGVGSESGDMTKETELIMKQLRGYKMGRRGGGGVRNQGMQAT